MALLHNSPGQAVANKYNPFRPDKIAPPGIFAGRMEEIRFIDHTLLQTQNGNPQHFLIVGERGIGKSSLIILEQFVARGQLKTLSGQQLHFIVINVSLHDGDDQFSLIRKISAELKRELEQRNILKTFMLQAWDFLSRFEGGGFRYNREISKFEESELLFKLQEDFVRLLTNLPEGVDGVLLLIDEADKGPDAGLGLICKLLTEELSRRGCERLCIGLAGLPNVVQVLKASHESSPRIFKSLDLRPLEVDERAQVLRMGVKEASEKNGFPIVITDGAVAIISNLSEGYPHFLQEFAYAAFEEDNDNTIDVEDATSSLFKENGPFDQLGRKFFAQYYATPSSDDYRAVLHAMAPHLDQWVDRATVIEESGLKGGTVDNALRALRAKNIILKDETRQGFYRLPTQAFAVWLRARATAKTAAAGRAEANLFDLGKTG